MKINGKLHGILMAGFLALMISPVMAQENQESFSQDLPQVLQQGEITYTTGGFGLEERDALKATVKNYNLIISNANKQSQYTAETTIVITGKGNQMALTVDDAGPLLYARLPAGTYVVKATNGDEKSVRTLSITGQKQARIHFIWSSGSD
jgi:hypothetical protein